MLDVGTGSGYHAALLSLLAAHVWTVERHRDLSADAERAIARPGIDNVTFVVGDGWDGLPDEAPFDAINVAAATGDADTAARSSSSSPTAAGWSRRSGPGNQHLMLTRRTGDRLVRRQLEAVQFVPLVHGVSE